MKGGFLALEVLEGFVDLKVTVRKSEEDLRGSFVFDDMGNPAYFILLTSLISLYLLDRTILFS
jgi:hypothetical protein